MQKYGSEFLEKFKQAKDELSELSQSIYSPRDVATILSSLGTQVELFFKSVVFPCESPWRPFKYFINCLEGVLNTEQIAELHKFRELYNFARHNPRLGIGVMKLRSVLDSIEPIINEIISLNIGRSQEVVSIPTRRMYWIAAWEHLDNAEVHIMVPSNEDVGLGPPELDLIHLEVADWPHAKQLLATTSQVSVAAGNVPDELIETWKKSKGFIEAICFEGEYRELLTSLSRFESRSTPMHGISRSDCSQCVLVACLMAFVDVFSSIETPVDAVEQVVKQVASNYAINRSTAAELDQITEELVNFSQHLWERGDAGQLVGPLWASNNEYRELAKNAIVESEEYLFMVDDQYCLIALHS